MRIVSWWQRMGQVFEEFSSDCFHTSLMRAQTDTVRMVVLESISQNGVFSNKLDCFTPVEKYFCYKNCLAFWKNSQMSAEIETSSKIWNGMFPVRTADLKWNALFCYLLQWKPLNVITLGPGICDRLKRMITITDGFY